MTIIGVSGWAQSGKDSLGRFLVDPFGFQQYAFATYLREVTAAFDPIVHFTQSTGHCGCDCHRTDGFGLGVKHMVACCNPTMGSVVRWSEAMKTLGYEGAKAQYPEFRRALQYMGTEVVRKKISDSFWVDHIFETIAQSSSANHVITDVRFKNEAQAVKDHGGICVWISRPDVGPQSDHASEHDLDDWQFDVVVYNDEGLPKLKDEAGRLL